MSQDITCTEDTAQNAFPHTLTPVRLAFLMNINPSAYAFELMRICPLIPTVIVCNDQSSVSNLYICSYTLFCTDVVNTCGRVCVCEDGRRAVARLVRSCYALLLLKQLQVSVLESQSRLQTTLALPSLFAFVHSRVFVRFRMFRFSPFLC